MCPGLYLLLQVQQVNSSSLVQGRDEASIIPSQGQWIFMWPHRCHQGLLEKGIPGTVQGGTQVP